VGRQLQRFFEDHKGLERKSVIVHELLGPAEARRATMDAIRLYQKRSAMR